MDDPDASDGFPSMTDPTPEAALERARYVANLMDSAFTVPGTDIEVGLDPILGILPVGGDAVSAGMSLYIVAEGARAGVPKEELAKMLLLTGIDFGVGSIPVVGTVFDTFWRSNLWNVDTIEKHLERAETTEGSDPDTDAVTIDIDDESEDEE
ncbi:DUF4112 domain-containing protein [Halobium salinum]|uniref:DUF4112 domain-containing protein n=1 Tax=Halobium salinum TaxID=1364940 RepID=A0ABD5PGI2_9EURY|nr:DUF4112 domain-containing protein [Halobium salinum]